MPAKRKKKGFFSSRNFFIVNIALASMIVGSVLSILLVCACSSDSQARLKSAYAIDDAAARTGYETLENIQHSLRNVAAAALPVVVEINVMSVVSRSDSGSPWDFYLIPPEEGGEGESAPDEYAQPGLGSGVIVERKGDTYFVITNNHVVGNATSISVLLFDGREYPAKIVAKDDRSDLAMVSFESGEEMPVAVLGDSDTVFVGDWAIVVGNPFGFQSTLTVGFISALSRSAVAGSSISTYNEYIQTDADINPGNSGGALLNIRGEVVGINTWIASETGSSMGIGFAIPVNSVKKVMADFLSKGRVEYGWLGVGIADPSAQIYPGVAEDMKIKDKKGALVLSVYDDSPADKAGIIPGDYILKMDGVPIANANHLTRIVGGLPANQRFDLVLIRFGVEKTVAVTLAVRESEDKVLAETRLWPGLTVVRLPNDIRARLKVPDDVNDPLVADVTAGARPATAGVKAFDLIVKINGNPVLSVMDFYKAVNAQGNIILTLWREGKELTVTVTRQP